MASRAEIIRQTWLQFWREQIGFIAGGVFLLEPFERACHQEQCPAAIEKFFRRGGFDGFELIRFLCGGFVGGNELMRAAAFQGAAFVPFVRQKMRERGEEERAKFSLLSVGFLESVLLEQPGEESLREVLGFVRIRAAPPNKSVNGIPITAAEDLERDRRAATDRPAPEAGTTLRVSSREGALPAVPCGRRWFARRGKRCLLPDP